MEQFENSPIKAHLHGQQKQWFISFYLYGII